MKCCGNCFGDRFLSIEIERRSVKDDRCDFCGSTDVALIDPKLLVDDFERVIFALYELDLDGDGKSLDKLLKEDWALFPSLDAKTAELLLKEILPGLMLGGYKPIAAHDSDAVVKWDELREELKHENRFFPQKLALKKDPHGSLFSYLSNTLEATDHLYRARLLKATSPYPIEEMGAPPREVASNGRANPIGIPYLYVATTKETAIAEIRPFTGATVCVATYEVKSRIDFVDLRNPLSSISPFIILDEEGIRLVRKHMPFLIRMGEELSKPVSPHKSSLEYLPSQYLCEFLKHLGFKGVAYKSSVGSGSNLAIFDKSLVTGLRVSSYTVDEVRVHTTPFK